LASRHYASRHYASRHYASRHYASRHWLRVNGFASMASLSLASRY
jgi:hypothetical protein